MQGVAAAFATRPLDVTDLGNIASAAGEIAQGIARRRVADVLQSSEEQVRQLQKMEAVGRLAGGIAHDFNNLLTVIIGYSELMLLELAPDDPQRRACEIIQTPADRAAQLTRQLLAFSRKQVLAPTLLDLNDVVTEMTAMLRRLIGASIELVFKPAEDPARHGRSRADRAGDRQPGRQRPRRDAGGGQITIETADVDLDDRTPRSTRRSPGPHVMLAVTDSGTGMDAATRSRIFEPFFTTKERARAPGSGWRPSTASSRRAAATSRRERAGSGHHLHDLLPASRGHRGAPPRRKSCPQREGTRRCSSSRTSTRC